MLLYLLRNSVNGKGYVGQTLQPLEKRLLGHRWAASCDRPLVIAKAIRKYAWSSFTVELLKECFSQEELNAEEKRFIIELGTLAPKGYNIANGGNGVGQHSEATKLKMSAQRKGRPAHDNLKRAVALANSCRVLSEETHKRLSESQRGNKKGLGRFKTDDEKRSIGVAQVGNKNHAAKLSWSIVTAIRQKHNEEKLSHSQLAKIFGTSRVNVLRIVNNQSWKQEYQQNT